MNILRRKEIPVRLYRRILAVMPIPCVDAVIVSRGKFLLGNRRNKPAKGQWFLIGGRVRKGERLEQALRRLLTEEAGITRYTIKKQLGARETIFRTSAQGPSSHTVNTVFLVEVPYRRYLPNNRENVELRWFSGIARSWHPYVKWMLGEAGFR